MTETFRGRKATIRKPTNNNGDRDVSKTRKKKSKSTHSKKKTLGNGWELTQKTKLLNDKKKHLHTICFSFIISKKIKGEIVGKYTYIMYGT